ncbi:hypothetical protein VTH06DRAFT_4138 [Thermothelomyces fergusii]
MSQSLLEFLVENEPSFRKSRLPALYSDFQTQRTLNPDGYQANVSAWRKALGRIVGSGLAPAGRGGAAPDLFVLHSDEQLLRALESKQYGRPLALGAVVRDALAARDLVPLREFLDAKESIYRRSWSVWNLASWTMKQLGVADFLRRDSLPSGQFVVVANVEEAGKAFGAHDGPAAAAQRAGSRFERTFTKAHFYRTFNDQLVEGRQLSETDMDVLLRFLSRDKSAIAYDGATVKIRSPAAADAAADDEPDRITAEDASIAQLRELVASLTHQTALLGRRIEELTAILAEPATAAAAAAAVDEAEVDDELAALEGEERRKAEEAARAEREERERREAEETRRRLAAAGEVPRGEPQERSKDAEVQAQVQAAEDLMSRMSLAETPER